MGLRRSAVLALLIVSISGGDAAAATTSVLDGIGGSAGRIHARIAEDTASIVRGGIPWVFYGANPEYGYRLRLAKLGPTPSFRTLDGVTGTNGRIAHSVATDVSAAVLGTTVHVFYRDDTAHTLRHAWLANDGWHFATLDGNSTFGGRTTHDVGDHSFAIVDGTELDVFYEDVTAGDLRRAVWDGTTWRFSVVDGNSTSGGRTTAPVGDAIGGGIWGSRLHVLYTEEPSGLREARLKLSGGWAHSQVSTLGTSAVSVLKVSNTRVHVAYVDGPPYDNRIESATWNGTAWSVDHEVSEVEHVTGLLLFMDGGVPILAAGIIQCYGSGGCDELIGASRWNGSNFDDPYFGGSFFAFADPPGVPSSAVTIGVVGRLFVGGFGYQTEPDIFDQILLSARGPF